LNTTIRQELLDRLSALLGEEGIERRPEELGYFAEDALRGRGKVDSEAIPPLAVIRPSTAAETVAVLALASEARVAVVPYGAGTGLMGGARSHQPGLVLDTVRLSSIAVLAQDRLVWAGAGAVLATVDGELAQHGLCLGHDPWTFPVATVGGTLSTNGLGYKGGRYGGMGEQAVALEVALTDGTLLRTRPVRRHSAGPDLARLFIGAEGTLGVITAAALKAYLIPEQREFRAYHFATFEDGFEVVNEIAALGLRPSLLDYGEEHASPWPELVGRAEEEPVLYLGFEGMQEEVEASLSRASRLVEAHGGNELLPEMAQRFWEQRHVIAERFARTRRSGRSARNPDVAFDYIHVALPPSRVLEFRGLCHAVAQREGIGLLECGLWTAPDYFSAVLVLPQKDGGHARLNQVIDRLLHSVQDMDGSMEYVHGAGLRLAHLMGREHGQGLDLLRRLKSVLDPAGVLNPGKLGLDSDRSERA
jgi:alkyldihydroxyacetonephosphate synthase